MEFLLIDEATGVGSEVGNTLDLRADQSSEGGDDDAPDARRMSASSKQPAGGRLAQALVQWAGCAGFGLATALAAQVAVHERNRVVAVAPQLRPSCWP